MPVEVACNACKNTLKIPDEIYERRVKGRVATLTCKRCRAPIEVDGREPSEKAEPASAPEVEAKPPAPAPPEAEAKKASPAAKKAPTPRVTLDKPAPPGRAPTPRPRMGSNDEIRRSRPALEDILKPRPKLASSGGRGSRPEVAPLPRAPAALESEVKTLPLPAVEDAPTMPLPPVRQLAGSKPGRDAFASPPPEDDDEHVETRPLPEVEQKPHAAPEVAEPPRRPTAARRPRPVVVREAEGLKAPEIPEATAEASASAPGPRETPIPKSDSVPPPREAPAPAKASRYGSLLGYAVLGFAAVLLTGSAIFGATRCGRDQSSEGRAQP